MENILAIFQKASVDPTEHNVIQDVTIDDTNYCRRQSDNVEAVREFWKIAFQKGIEIKHTGFHDGVSIGVTYKGELLGEESYCNTNKQLLDLWENVSAAVNGGIVKKFDQGSVIEPGSAITTNILNDYMIKCLGDHLIEKIYADVIETCLKIKQDEGKALPGVLVFPDLIINSVYTQVLAPWLNERINKLARDRRDHLVCAVINTIGVRPTTVYKTSKLEFAHAEYESAKAYTVKMKVVLENMEAGIRKDIRLNFNGGL